MTTITDQLNSLHGHVSPDAPSSGAPARVWEAEVTTVNPDGTVDCQPLMSRASKVAVPALAGYKPAVGDHVYLADLNGDPRTPVLLAVAARTPPAITGSRAGNAALASLLHQLAAAGVIIDNTTP